ncbi:MAG: TonB family protein [Gemmatimonadota bacterium]
MSRPCTAGAGVVARRVFVAISAGAAALVAPSASWAQAQAQAQAQAMGPHAPGPLYKSDLIRIMTSGGYTTDEVRQIVRISCVGFVPSERDRRDLGRFGGGDAVLAEIDRCRAAGAAAGYRNGVPVASRIPVGEEAALRPAVVRVEHLALVPVPVPVDVPSLAVPQATVLASPSRVPGVRADAPPRLLNWDAVTRRILAEYRPDVRHPGEVVLRIHVDAEGRPGEAAVERATGDPALVEAAKAAVPFMRFAPAESRGRRVESWAWLPIRFSAR